MKEKLVLLFTLVMTIIAGVAHAQDSLKLKGTTEPEPKIYITVDTMPKPPGGMPRFQKSIREFIVYPEEDSKMDREGMAYVQFIVEKNGAITGVEIVPGTEDRSTPAMQAEAVRVIELLGKQNWSPGIQNGKNVRVKFIMPIAFRLDL